MPKPIKVAISIIVVLVTIGAYFFQEWLGQTGPKFAILFLGSLMIVAMWLFPEVMRKEVRHTSRSRR